MSHSQKHSGKVFVPWYNTAEWKSVYQMLLADTRENNEKSLRIMKNWKIRTPLLSAGVEGTIIILEALLSDKINTPNNDEINQVYAISLLRFLNICAANNDKQGTFNKTATKNDLPKWLINIRHDIAHHHKLPSKSMLTLALEESLKWLLDKYWNVQNEMIADYVVTEELTNANIKETINTYNRLKINVYKEVDTSEYDEDLREKINYLITRRNNKKKTDVNGILDILEDMLKQSFAHQDNRNIGQKVARILVSETALLCTHCDSIVDGVEIIPRRFRDMWSNLLNIIFENGFLFHLLRQLLQVTDNIVVNNIHRKIASLWITEIFNGLLKLQAIVEELEKIKKQNSVELDSRTSKIILKTVLNQNNPEFDDCLEFEIPDKLPLIEAKLFEEKILKMPNEYTLNFFKRVMIFNKNSQECIDDTRNVIKKFILTDKVASMNENIMTLNDLDKTLNSRENINDSLCLEKTRPLAEDSTVNNGVAKSRWKVIEDTSSFEGCPLGILPNQNRAENPVLLIL